MIVKLKRVKHSLHSNKSTRRKNKKKKTNMKKYNIYIWKTVNFLISVLLESLSVRNLVLNLNLKGN